MKRAPCSWIVVLATLCVWPLHAQRFAYEPEVFEGRRQALCEAVGPQEGFIWLFGKTEAPPAHRFRQDNDFFYLTGNENLNAVLVMDAKNCDSFLFLPPQTEREATRVGWNWIYQEGAAEKWGFVAIKPVYTLQEFLARRRNGGPQTVFARLSERTEVDQSRDDIAIFTARRMASPWGSYPSEDAWRIQRIRELYPYYEIQDISPYLDALRTIKKGPEIEALRRNGYISAEAHRRAIAVTRVGGWEYEIEAAATHTLLEYGAEGPGYIPIVGSGPRVNEWHYERNERQLQEGDLVVMDYGASMGYLTIDITRTWPASGAFTELQEKAYRCVLEAQKAIIAAMKPGATREQTKAICRKIYDKWGFEDHWASGAGHYVGMSVHDVGDMSLPFSEGMVIAVEPIIDLPEHQLHIRIEDTVLITEDGHEVLTDHVPKEVDELLALMGSQERE